MNALANVDAEKTVLGCALLDATALHIVLAALITDDFSLDSNRRIFHMITELANKGKAVDDLTVCDALAEKEQLATVGGAAYIADLSRQVDAGFARTVNVEDYAAKLRDKS